MAFDVDQIRAVGQRVAASHGLDVVEIEFSGGAKHRTLRVFIEKNAEERQKLLDQVEAGSPATEKPDIPTPGTLSAGSGQGWGTQIAGMDQLAGVTHTDCEAFSRDFGTVLDVEDLIPGGEYTLEVSSPGLDRKLRGIADYRRFAGMLAKVQTFEPVEGNRHWQGRLTEVGEGSIRLAMEARKSGPRKKGAGHRVQASGKTDSAEVEIALKNIEKAQLVPEF